MAVSLEGKLVVAISSRALFNFEEENRVFEQANDRAYMQLQLERLEVPAPPVVPVDAAAADSAAEETPKKKRLRKKKADVGAEAVSAEKPPEI